jgi:hypothetical protein
MLISVASCRVETILGGIFLDAVKTVSARKVKKLMALCQIRQILVHGRDENLTDFKNAALSLSAS